MSGTDRLFFALFPTLGAAAQVYSLQQELRVRHGLWGRPLAIDRMGVHQNRSERNRQPS